MHIGVVVDADFFRRREQELLNFQLVLVLAVGKLDDVWAAFFHFNQALVAAQ